MRMIVTLTFCVLAFSVMALALPGDVPEINPGQASTALTLLGGAVLVFRGRRR